MKYNFKALVDIPKLQELTDELYALATIPSSIIAMDGEILTGSGWQKICTDFHRQHPQTEKECIESDTRIRVKIEKGETFAIYKCPRGLFDASSPIVIDGEHVANVFSGQVFLEPPDDKIEQFFREQARKFGFDEGEYLNAFKKIPVLTKEKFRAGISYIAKLSHLIADIGFTRLKELNAMELLRASDETSRALLNASTESVFLLDQKGIVYGNDITARKRAEEAQRESEERYRVLVENAGEAIFIAQGGLLKFANKKTMELSGYTREELTSRSYTDFIHPDDRATVLDRHLKRRQGIEVPSNYSLRIVQRSGEVKWAELNVVQIDWQDKPATLNFLRDITERKQAEEGLRASQRQLRAFAGRLQKIREEERIMISREIHDVMGGGLTGLKMDLSWLMHKLENVESDKKQAAFMSRVLASSESIDNMIQVVRRISTELRPPVLDDLGLIAALEWQLSEFTSRTDIRHELATAFEYVSMEADTAIAVFRIFQEAITNVVRHSQATKVTVVLREEERSFSEEASYVLEIRDNGRGITEEEILNPKSLGLLGMQERVLAFGGDLSIRGEPGGGTSVILKIPQDKKASPQA